MHRRDVIVLLGGIASAWPTVAGAQETRLRRIGVLMAVPAADRDGLHRVTRFRQTLQERGWTEGLDVRIACRWGGDPELHPRYAAELVALAPDVILAGSGQLMPALLERTRTVPIVFVSTVNPVGRGYVGSLSRPGGNA